jgi:hypothetical protein
LNEYLVRHPNVERGLIEKGSRYFDVNFDKGWDWFTHNFPSQRHIDRIASRTGIRPILGESSPYYCYHQQAPARIAERLPDARLLLLLREPVARAWSHYNYEKSLGYETLDIHRALDSESERLEVGTQAERAHADRHFTYVARSMYAEQVERLWEHFAPEQLMIIESERLFSDPQAVMNEAYAHCGLTAHTDDFSDAFKRNRYEDIPSDVVDRLAPVFAASNARLRELCGDRISWLSV